MEYWVIRTPNQAHETFAARPPNAALCQARLFLDQRPRLPKEQMYCPGPTTGLAMDAEFMCTASPAVNSTIPTWTPP